MLCHRIVSLNQTTHRREHFFVTALDKFLDIMCQQCSNNDRFPPKVRGFHLSDEAQHYFMMIIYIIKVGPHCNIFVETMLRGSGYMPIATPVRDENEDEDQTACNENFTQGEIAAHEPYKVGDMHDSQSQFIISTQVNQCTILDKSVQLL